MSSKQTNSSAIFSLRIVSIDNYMKSPLFGLDTCYSEFRGDEVKQVSSGDILSLLMTIFFFIVIKY